MRAIVLDRVMRSLYVEDRRRPRTLQAVFVLPTALVVLTLWVFHRDLARSSTVGIGVGLVVLATVLSVLVPWRRLPARAVVVLPLLDFAAVGFLRWAAGNESSAVALLCVFPALWLAVILELTGALLAAALTVLVATVPSVIASDEPVDPFIVLRHLLLPLVIWIVTSLLVGGMVVSRRHLDALEAQGRELYDALQDARRNELLLHNVLDTLAVGVVVVDAAGNGIIRNQAQAALHALASPGADAERTEAELLLYHLDRVTPLAPEERPVRRVVDGESFSGAVMRLGDPAVEQRVVSCSGRQMSAADGTREGGVVVFTDVTELTELVAERQSFVSTVSHELRTPITSIIGYLDLLREDGAPRSEESELYLDVIERNAEQVLAIVQDVLSTAPARAGVRMTRVPTDLDTLLEGVIASARPLAAEKGLELRAELAPLPPVPADPARLTQVFDNLLTNGIKYTPTGGRVVVATREVPGAVEVEVSDTGHGMSPEDQGRLFRMYFRSESARRQAIPGVGLGLVISKQIVEAHGGGIAVESVLGQGSTFRVRLPVVTERDMGDR